MNIYIMADIEGISGIYCRDQVLWNERYYAEGRELMTWDINICAAAFYPDYCLYIADFENIILSACKWLTEHGYQGALMSEVSFK